MQHPQHQTSLSQWMMCNHDCREGGRKVILYETAGMPPTESVTPPIFHAKSHKMRFENWQTHHFLKELQHCLNHGLSISMLFSSLFSIHVLTLYFIATHFLVAVAVWQAFVISGGDMDLVMLNVERWRHGMDAGMMDVSMALGILALAFCEGIGTPEWIR